MIPFKKDESYAVSLGETFRLIRSDYRARLKFYALPHSLTVLVNMVLMSGFLAMVAHRLAHYLYFRGLRLPARLLYLANISVTGADISPITRIGESFIMLHSAGTIIAGRVGNNVVCTALVAVGGNGSREDIGAGPGLPVIGDGASLATRCTILGPYRIGEGAKVGPSTLVLKHVPAGATIFGTPGRIVKGLESAAVEAGAGDVDGKPGLREVSVA